MPDRASATRKGGDFTTVAIALGTILGGLLGMLLGDAGIGVGAAVGAGAGFMVGAALDSRGARPPRADGERRRARPA